MVRTMKHMKRKAAIAVMILLLCLSESGCRKKEEEETEEIVFQTLSKNISEVTEGYSSQKPLTYEIVQEESILSSQKTKVREATSKRNGYWWVADKVYNGTPKKKQAYYKYTYDIYGDLLSKVEIPETEVIINAEDTIFEFYGDIAVGSIFYPSFTKFGYDCGGCWINEEGYTTLASGIGARDGAIRQYDESWEEGITYEGYYMIAMTTLMPICTVVEISDHAFSGMGLEPGVPFKAIVADRGVRANKIDLFVGSEHNLSVVKTVKRHVQPKVTILSLGTVVRKNGHRACKV